MGGCARWVCHPSPSHQGVTDTHPYSKSGLQSGGEGDTCDLAGLGQRGLGHLQVAACWGLSCRLCPPESPRMPRRQEGRGSREQPWGVIGQLAAEWRGAASLAHLRDQQPLVTTSESTAGSQTAREKWGSSGWGAQLRRGSVCRSPAWDAPLHFRLCFPWSAQSPRLAGTVNYLLVRLGERPVPDKRQWLVALHPGTLRH